MQRDKDGNGRLSLDESRLRPSLFKKLDESENGELSLDEFRRIWHDLAGRAEHENLSYAQDSERQKLDLYLPSRLKAEMPLVIWIHGGSWKRGSKDFNPFSTLAQHDYIVASINYRFTQEALFPAQYEDCVQASRWLRRELKSRYGVKVKRICSVGLSAGGHLSMLLAAKGDIDQAISFGAPSNLANAVGIEAYRQTLESLVGSPLEDHLKELREASPQLQVNQKSGEFLLFHGTGDRRVSAQEALNMAQTVAEHNGSAEVRIVSDGSHTIVGGPKAWNQILNFLDEEPVR